MRAGAASSPGGASPRAMVANFVTSQGAGWWRPSLRRLWLLQPRRQVATHGRQTKRRLRLQQEVVPSGAKIIPGRSSSPLHYQGSICIIGISQDFLQNISLQETFPLKCSNCRIATTICVHSRGMKNPTPSYWRMPKGEMYCACT